MERQLNPEWEQVSPYLPDGKRPFINDYFKHNPDCIMGDLVIKEIYDRREFECQRQCSNDELIKKLESQSLFESPKEMNASPSMTKERHYLLRRLEKLKQQQISLKNERLFIEDLLS